MPGILTVSPLADPNNYDIITLAGITSNISDHGIVEVSKAERKFSWDIKKTAGSQGQTITYRGWGYSEPEIKFKFWTDEQIREWYDVFFPVLYYDIEKTSPKPVDVYHPKLFVNQIYWIAAQEIGELAQEGAQLWSVTAKFVEYRQAKAKNATSTPQTANSNQNGKGTKPTAEDAQDAEIRALTREFMRPL